MKIWWREVMREVRRIEAERLEREPLYERTLAFDPWNTPPSFEEQLAKGWIRPIRTPNADALLDSMGIRHE